MRTSWEAIAMPIPAATWDSATLTVLGVSGSVLALFGLLVNRQPAARPRPWLGPVGAFLLALGGLLLLLAGWHPPLGAAFLILGAVWGLFCLARWRLLNRRAARLATALTEPRWQWLALLVVGPALALVPAGHVGGWAVPPIPFVQATVTAAATDQAHPVQVLLVSSEPTPSPGFLAAEQGFLRQRGLLGRVLPTAPANQAYNCHGWVFGAGRCLIMGDEVGLILTENGYQVVPDPRPSDLILYHDTPGQFCHSGVVRVADPEGPVLVESKWDWMGRYLHPPEAQPYAAHWTYYRSTRPGHVLHDLPSLPVSPGPAAPAWQRFVLRTS
jgi:hypothetical protein